MGLKLLRGLSYRGQIKHCNRLFHRFKLEIIIIIRLIRFSGQNWIDTDYVSDYICLGLNERDISLPQR